MSTLNLGNHITKLNFIWSPVTEVEIVQYSQTMQVTKNDAKVTHFE